MASEHAFLAAIRSGDVARVKALLADRPELARLRQGGASAVLLAQYCHKPAVAAALRPYCGALDVFEAAALGDLARLRALLAAEPARANAVADDGFSPLNLACLFGQEAAVRLLLERGADVTRPSANAMKLMPLHSAATIGSLPIVRLLLRHGADPAFRDENGLTAAEHARRQGHKALAERLAAASCPPPRSL